jgi:cell wall-associated NlpC family hydrolase
VAPAATSSDAAASALATTGSATADQAAVLGRTLSRGAGPAASAPRYTYATSVPMAHGCWNVSPAITGVKVYLVQRALHLVGHKERYDSATVAAVRAFQAGHELPVTGVVDARTWAALGTGYDFCVDRYTVQPTVPYFTTAAARVEAMIGYARGRLGLPYVWGGAGPVGFDCSGLVLQALYAGGVVVPGITTDLHVQADFRTTQALYASSLTHVPYSQRQRGDLVFYGSPISHMAIELGDGTVLEAVRPVVRVAREGADGLAPQPLVVRPFPG